MSTVMAHLSVLGKGYECLYDQATSQCIIPAFEDCIRDWYERFDKEETFDAYLEVIGGDCILASDCQVKVLALLGSIGDRCWVSPVCSAQSESLSTFPTGINWQKGTPLMWRDVKVDTTPALQDEVRRLQVNITQDAGKKVMGGHLFVPGDVPKPSVQTSITAAFGDAIEIKANQAEFVASNIVQTLQGEETMLTWFKK